MSVLISAKPTLEVLPQGNRVREARGAIYITQPTPITVTGTATPTSPHARSVVQIFAKDGNGNLVNGGAPLATATPDFSGQYTATLSLPSRLRKDVNTLFAREVAVGSFVSQLQINPTTLSGLNGDLTINGTTLNDLTATINNPASTGTLTGSIITPSTPITGIGGTITIPAFPTNGPGGAGTAGPATGTLLGGTGTLDPQVGTINGSIASPATTSALVDGTGAIDPTTGAFTQTGTAAIAGTTGTSTLMIEEVAVSEPITVVIHQSQAVPGTPLRLQGPRALLVRDGAPGRVHGLPNGPRALAARALLRGR